MSIKRKKKDRGDIVKGERNRKIKKQRKKHKTIERET